MEEVEEEEEEEEEEAKKFVSCHAIYQGSSKKSTINLEDWSGSYVM